jgi:hypothetical protein
VSRGPLAWERDRVGAEDGRLPEQLQSEAHAGAHGTKAVVVALLANLGIAVAKWHSVGPCSLPSPVWL